MSHRHLLWLHYEGRSKVETPIVTQTLSISVMACFTYPRVLGTTCSFTDLIRLCLVLQQGRVLSYREIPQARHVGSWLCSTANGMRCLAGDCSVLRAKKATRSGS